MNFEITTFGKNNVELNDILPHPRAIAAFAVIAFSLVLTGPARAEDFPVVVTAPPLSPEEQLKKFHLPPGFEIQLVAAEPEVVKPINMAFDARGRLLFTQSVEYPFPALPPKVPRDTVQIIDGFDERGHAKRISTFVDKLNIPLGVAPVPDGVIVYSTPNIYLCLDPQHTGHATERKVLYGEFQSHDTHGMNNSFTRGLDGWIYANHGFSNDDTVAGADGQKIHMSSGNTYRMRADGSHLEYFSHGRVNPFGICFDPLNNMYVTDCETLPIYLHLRGAYYPSFGKPHDGLGFGPAMMDHMHGSSAIAGIVYYAATQFPPEYRDTMFIGNPVTHRINHDRLTPRGSFFWADSTADFLSCDDQWFRPVDLKLGPDGALYVADFYNRIIGHYEVPLTHPGRDHTRGRIWRIVWVGTNGEPPNPTIPNLAEMTAEQLIERLGDPNLTVRTLATHELVDRIGKPAIAPLQKLLADAKSQPTQRAHGLWVLQRLGALTDELIEKLAADPDRLVRVHLIQALAERPDWNKETLYTAAAGKRGELDDPDPFVRRAVVEALGRHPGLENVEPLVEVWAHAPAEDTHLIHAAQETRAINWKCRGSIRRSKRCQFAARRTCCVPNFATSAWESRRRNRPEFLSDGDFRPPEQSLSTARLCSPCGALSAGVAARTALRSLAVVVSARDRPNAAARLADRRATRPSGTREDNPAAGTAIRRQAVGRRAIGE